MKEGAFLYFRITGLGVNFDEITNRTGVEPSLRFHKGDVIKTKYRENICEIDCWVKNYEIPEEQTLDEAIMEVIHPFLAQKGYISSLSQKYNVTLWLSIYPESHQMNIKFSPKVITNLAELKIEFGITIMDLADLYEGIQ